MAESVGLTMAVLAFTRPFFNASANAGDISSDQADLLREYSVYMKLVENCTSTVSRANNLPSSVVSDALTRCTALGEELVCRQVDTSLPVLVTWDKLEAEFDRFRRSVLLLHGLTQECDWYSILYLEPS